MESRQLLDKINRTRAIVGRSELSLNCLAGPDVVELLGDVHPSTPDDECYKMGYAQGVALADLLHLKLIVSPIALHVQDCFSSILMGFFDALHQNGGYWSVVVLVVHGEKGERRITRLKTL